jgi:hypothetical protein
MEVIAFYLPQYHVIPENNKWWGEGYTEWKNVKGAKPLFAGHYQPRVPLNENYYDLLDTKVMIEQSKLAKAYGVTGFAYYHYWFDGKRLLEKPVENMRRTPEIDMPYCLVWANEEWKKYWYGQGEEVLINQNYGSRKNWEEHFEYLLDFFKDERYIKIDGKPVFIIYRSGVMRQGKQMVDCWNRLAQKHGLPGIYIIGMKNWEFETKACAWLDAMVDYEPTKEQRLKIMKKRIYDQKKLRERFDFGIWNRLTCDIHSYAHINRQMLRISHEDNEFRGVFVDFDNSARAKKHGLIFYGSNPKRFKKYFSEHIRLSKKEGKDYIFINAWNEWGEGCYLEPDTKFKYGYLEAVRSALKENGEWNE